MHKIFGIHIISSRVNLKLNKREGLGIKILSTTRGYRDYYFSKFPKALIIACSIINSSPSR